MKLINKLSVLLLIGANSINAMEMDAPHSPTPSEWAGCSTPTKFEGLAQAAMRILADKTNSPVDTPKAASPSLAPVSPAKAVIPQALTRTAKRRLFEDEITSSGNAESDTETGLMPQPGKCKKSSKKSAKIGRAKKSSNEKKHICLECGQGFTRASSLKDHGYIHSGVLPYSMPLLPLGIYSKNQPNKSHSKSAPWQRNSKRNDRS